MKILLVGNPNVGKSVIFNCLTGLNVMVSNYPGTTVGFTQGNIDINKQKIKLIDVPGIYSLTPSCRAEEIAVQMLDEMDERDLIINVINANQLERNLRLTMEVLKTGKPVIVILNMWDEMQRKGRVINLEKLQDLLGVPVLATSGIRGEGIDQLVEQITRDINQSAVGKKNLRDPSKQENDLDKIIQAVQTTANHHQSAIIEKLHLATIKPLTGIPLAIMLLLLSIVGMMGTCILLLGFAIIPLLNKLYLPLIEQVSIWLGGTGFIHAVLVGNLVDGELHLFRSMGLLTMGVAVPLMILSFLIGFYLILNLLEDSGYLPRLAVLVDSIFSRLGMHGYAFIPTFLGLGCNIIGVFGVRILETRRQKFIAMTLMAIVVPCIAQIAMMFAFFFGMDIVLGNYRVYAGEIDGVFYHFWQVALTLVIIYIIGGLIMNKFVKRGLYEDELLLEIPPYRWPQPRAIFKKLWLRMKAFVTEAIPLIMLGILIVNILYIWGVLDFIGNIAAPVIVGLFGLPKEAVVALVAGFIRKDVAIGVLIPLVVGGLMSAEQLVIAAVILIIYFPCYATFIVMLKELGWRDTLYSVGIMIVTVLTVGTILRLLLIGF